RELGTVDESTLCRGPDGGTDAALPNARPKCPDVTNLYGTAATEVGGLSPSVIEEWRALGPADSHFEILFWAGCDGQQLLKATSATQNTPPISVAQREYFRAARDNRLWLGSTPARYVEPVRSLTTGKFATNIAIRSGDPVPNQTA